jgi:nitroimidazol reductase NimA-like FMN-containing flavoprotein (pyridoxamine 5'-phosphate oxidase superfamily)
MLLEQMTENQCHAAFERASFGRLGISDDDQPYVVPVYFAYEAGYVYILSTQGQKIESMRRNPKVCLEFDDIAGETEWISVIALGRYQELIEPQFSAERARARTLLERRPSWWQPAFAERELKAGRELIDPIFFRIHIDSISGLQAISENTPKSGEHKSEEAA